MKLPKDAQEFSTRLKQAQQKYHKRNQLVMLCNEMYEMKKSYKSNWLGADAVRWRSKASIEYWESDSRPQNVVDVLSSVLSANPIQWKAYTADSLLSTLPSRAEKFLAGVIRLNSRRQQIDLLNYIAFRTALDGGCGIRIYWDTEAPNPSIVKAIDAPDGSGLTAPLALHDYQNFPIVMDVVPISNLYPVGRGKMGKPFDELYHTDMRTPGEVISEWEGTEGASLGWMSEYSEEDKNYKECEYVEWWAEDKDGQVWYACTFDNRYVIKPKQIDYPTIPYVLTTFKLVDRKVPEMERVPFIYPIIWATQKKEYLRSRNFRLADMYGNMPPISRGDNPVSLSGIWGDSLNLGPDDSIEFPRWPGNPPDIYKMLEESETTQAEGTFSPAMFGQVSSRMSGYALGQLVGADTLRVDTPKRNLEISFGLVADIIFGLLRQYSGKVYRGIIMEMKGGDLAPMISGDETSKLLVEAVIKPRHVADEIRLATLGAQLASLPKPPVSQSYILSHYFGIEQPEDEIRQRIGEEAMQDPLVRLVSMFEVLSDAEHFAAPIIEKQIAQLTSQQLGAAPPGGAPQMGATPAGPAQLGGGLPQAVGGNPPMPGPTGNPMEEAEFSPEAALYGGPREV